MHYKSYRFAVFLLLYIVIVLKLNNSITAYFFSAIYIVILPTYILLLIFLSPLT